MRKNKITVEGKSVEEAMAKAANDLGVAVGSIDYEILKKSGGAFFGLFGAGKVELQAWIRSERSEENGGRERSRGRGGRGSRDGRANSRPNDRRHEARPERAERSERNDDDEDDVRISAAPLEPQVLEALKEELRTFCADICAMIVGDAVAVTAEINDGRLMLNIDDDRMGDVINKNTKLAEAMEHILRKKPRHLRQELPFRIFLDAGGVRKAREKELVQMAQDLSLQVHENRKPIVLNYKSSYDRKIIHMALDKDDRVYTKSIGSGPNRKLMILPSRGSQESSANA